MFAEAGLQRHVLEPSVAVAAPQHDAAAVDGVVEIVGQDVRIFLNPGQVEEILRLEIVAEEQVETAVVVEIERDGCNRVAEFGEPGARGDVGEGAVAVVVVEDRRAEADDEQIAPAVVVVVEPERVGDDRPRIVAAAHAGLRRDVGEREVAVVVKEVARRAVGRIGDEQIVEAVVVVVADGNRRAAGGEHPQHVGVRTFEHARVVADLDAGALGDLLEPNRGRSGGDVQPGRRGGDRDARHGFAHKSCRLVSTRFV